MEGAPFRRSANRERRGGRHSLDLPHLLQIRGLGNRVRLIKRLIRRLIKRLIKRLRMSQYSVALR